MLKKILSYFIDISLEKSNSAYNPYLEVLLVKGRNQLITKNAIYSFDDKYKNFYDSFKRIDWDKLNVKNVLILGLGLGSVIYMLEKKFKKNFTYTCVEIDPEIIRLAQKYTFNNLNSNIEIYQTDAEGFVRLNSQKYDLILMDVFQNAKIPQKFDNIEFIEELKTKLSSNALLLYNRMNINQEDNILNTNFAKNFKSVFPEYIDLKVLDNLVFFSRKDIVLKN